jgi:DnaK suppressor protein
MLNLDDIKTKLSAKLKELQERAAELEESLCELRDPDSSERAIELENDQTDSAIAQITDDEIRDIQLALRRIDSGDYSTCIVCGKHIPQARLVALPWTSRCATCA